MTDYIDVEFEPSSVDVKFFTYKNQQIEVRVLGDKNIWVAISDFCKAVGMTNATRTASLAGEKHHKKLPVEVGRDRWFASVRGIASIVDRCLAHKHAAEQFLEWVTEELVPAIAVQTAAPASDATEISTKATPTRSDTVALQIVRDVVQDMQLEMARGITHLHQEMQATLQTHKDDITDRVTGFYKDEIKEMYKDVKEVHAEAQAKGESLKLLTKEHEETRQTLAKQQDTQATLAKSNIEHTTRLTRELKEAKEECARTREEKEQWKLRARRWGKKLLKHTDGDVGSDGDLYDLKKGVLL